MLYIFPGILSRVALDPRAILPFGTNSMRVFKHIWDCNLFGIVTGFAAFFVMRSING